MAKNNSKPNKNLVLGFLFAISYVFLYILSLMSEQISGIITIIESWVSSIPVLDLIPVLIKSFLPTPAFSSPMYFLLPVVGFFTIYLMIDWINEMFKTETGYKAWLPLVFVIFSMFAFYIALYWYWCNAFSMGVANPVTCSSAGSQKTAEFLSGNFPQLLRQSAFSLFILAGTLGWLARFAIKEIFKE
ncbi:MAG: hypothetical protein V1672_05145 [Candidatus Diapherotrites archaeon]